MAATIVSASDWKPGTPISYQLGVGNHAFNIYNAAAGYSYDLNAGYALSSVDNNSLRFEVRAGDNSWFDGTSADAKERSEIGTVERYDYHVPLHVSYDFSLERGAANTAKWMVVGQIHQEFAGGDAGPPPFVLMMVGEKMSAQVRGMDASGNLVNKMVWLDTANIVRGQDYHFDVYAEFDAKGEGRLVLARDGQVVLNYSGPMGYATEGEVYWKEGIYRAPAAETVAATFSNLQISNGDTVQIPEKSAKFVDLQDAPTLALSGTSATAGGGKAGIEGHSAPNAVVNIYDSDRLLKTVQSAADGTFRAAVDLGAGTHFLTAAAKGTDGRLSAVSSEIPIEVGTAASVLAKMNILTGMQSLGDIILTDAHTFTVSSLSQMNALISSAKETLAFIDGGYDFAYWSGSSNNRTVTKYDKNGMKTEATTTLTDSGGIARVTHQLFNSTDYVTKDITFYQITGTTYSSIHQGYAGLSLVTTERFHADGTFEYANYLLKDGTKITRSYSDLGVIQNEVSVNSLTTTTKLYADGVIQSESAVSKDGTKDVKLYDHGILTTETITKAGTPTVIIDHSVQVTPEPVVTAPAEGPSQNETPPAPEPVITVPVTDVPAAEPTPSIDLHLGDDIYHVNSLSDLISEQSNGGQDTVYVSLNQYILSDNIETLSFSGSGNAVLTGNALANKIAGGAGADVLDGGDGIDDLSGGGGNDVYIVNHPLDQVIELSGGGSDTVKTSVSYTLGANVEKLVLLGSDAINGNGNALANTITGNEGANKLAGDAGDDIIGGEAGNDTLRGDAGDDTLSGGAGNDIIVGGVGIDRLTGGTGSDRFVFAQGDSGRSSMYADKITDFQHAEGDIIDLSALDANTKISGDQGFTFYDSKPTAPIAGSLWTAATSAYTQVLGDTNGDGMADFVLLVSAIPTQLVASDFLL